MPPRHRVLAPRHSRAPGPHQPRRRCAALLPPDSSERGDEHGLDGVQAVGLRVVEGRQAEHELHPDRYQAARLRERSQPRGPAESVRKTPHERGPRRGQNKDTVNAFPTDATVRSLHSSVSGNALRASVLGANDGLVSSLSLVMGVAGAGLSSRTILITGIAGLLAGAGSMAMGEWISVQSSRELHERELAVERAEIADQPERERQELVELYERRRVPALDARELADVLMADQDVALEVMAREELGFDPDALGGSPWTAAGSSFALFVA
ncbi:MAG: VIT1/CCC1 transporter family protein, partial [Actinobacteria bacterium]|nr:VIT1/CCC1 transporter family protein [Actinomycetota bacterium]